MIFERIFLRMMNQLYIHLRGLEIYPVETAMTWMASLFVGPLKVDQTLQLFDRLIGFNSLYLLPVLSLAIFKFYEKNLLEARNKKEVEDLLERTKDLNVLELVNNFLFD